MCITQIIYTCGHVFPRPRPCNRRTALKNKLKATFSSKPEETCTRIARAERLDTICVNCESEARDAQRQAGQPWNVRVLRVPQKIVRKQNNNTAGAV